MIFFTIFRGGIHYFEVSLGTKICKNFNFIFGNCRTRAVQKVIESIKRIPFLIPKVISSLNPGVLGLMTDANGSHVIQRCLQHMDPECTMVRIKYCIKKWIILLHIYYFLRYKDVDFALFQEYFSN